MDQKFTSLESVQVFKTPFPSPQATNSRKASWWSPTATKALPAMLKCSERSSNTNLAGTAKQPPAPLHKSPTKVPFSPRGRRLMGVSTQRNKENTATCTEILKDCLCILQKVIECLGYQNVSRQSSTKASHVPVPLLAASFKHHFRGNTSPVFLVAAYLQTVLF